MNEIRLKHSLTNSRPNHACVAGAGFGWYLVVDSDQGGDEIVDVWVRWRGW